MHMMSKVSVVLLLIYSTYAFSVIPGQVNFQGVLLDDNGQTVNTSVNFDFALFDAITGGSQLWSESQTAVPVTDGMYTVALGSVVALSAEILNTSTVYLEISVEGEILSPRQRLLAVPYALKAEEAENVSGVSGIFVQQLFINQDWDGQAIANDDPLEGVDDVDGDGLANFIDPDNDNDGINDDLELSNGTAVNLVTPVISSITSGTAGTSYLETVTGSGFLAGLSVQVGPENPVPQNLTSTSFDISVGATQVAGTTSVTVTNPNAEVATGSMVFHGKLAFVTSTAIANAGNLSLAEADAFCNAAASAAGLSGNFVAWYSDTAGGINAKDRLASNISWTRLDGVEVATDLADLTDGTISAAIDINENGDTVAVAGTVATKTFNSGLLDASNCSNPNGIGLGGRSDSTTEWSYHSTSYMGCGSSAPLYCFAD